MTSSTDLITTLSASIEKLDSRDREFAHSLVDCFNRRGSLSERQWPWVSKLIDRANPKPAAEPADAVDLSRLTALFDKAAQGMKRPQVAFACNAGEFVVSRAGDNSANPGFLYLKTVDKSYLGKISPKGHLSMARNTNEDQQVIFEALAGFAADPQGAAAAYGKETGFCCFCSRTLTDDRSVSVGYGPICADRWGLPWGE